MDLYREIAGKVNDRKVRELAANLLQMEQREMILVSRATLSFADMSCCLGFRQFSLRGLEAVSGEWKLVTMAFSLKRMPVLAGA